MCCDINSQSPHKSKGDFKAPKGYKVGDKATDFNLKSVDGDFYSLESIENAKGYIVVFTSNVCPYAVMYEDRLIKLHNDMAPLGYPVVAINSNDASMEEGDSFENMIARSKEKGFPFIYLDDKDQTIYPQYGASKTPHVFLLDNEMTVQYIGAIDDNAKVPEDVETLYVRDAVAAIENGESPEPSFTKAIGCPIKSKNASAHGGGGPPHGGKRRGPPDPKEIMSMMDSNSDKKISADEAHGPLKRDFDRLDADKDGFLTSAELEELKKRGGK